MTASQNLFQFRAVLAVAAFAFAVLAAWTVVAAQPTGAAAPRAVTAAGPGVLPTITVGSLPRGAVVTPVLLDMNNPTAMVFDPAGRLFYTEKGDGSPSLAAVRLFENGVLQPAPVINFTVNATNELGLLGITLDPDFSANHLVYVYYTSAEQGPCGSGFFENRVVRFVETGGVGSNPQTIFTSCHNATIHAGGNVHFGPDGKLYVTIGDNSVASNAQDATVKPGKIHRLNPDGSIPADNPVITSTGQISSVFALGLRNSFDFDFDPLTPANPWPRLFASENGPGCDDEMNRIEAGYDYGWRSKGLCEGSDPDPAYNTIPPMWFLRADQCCQAPTGTQVYTGTALPEWTNDLFMCAYNSGALRHFYLDPTRTQALTVATVEGVTCNMEVESGPDGAFYYIEGGGYAPGTLFKITVPGAVEFQDVPPSNTFHPFVSCLARTGIVQGYPCGGPGEPCVPPNSLSYFRPNAYVTRGQIAKIVSESASFGQVIPPDRRTFEDVTYGSTFWLYIERLAETDIVEGYACGGPGEPCGTENRPYFRPNASATRGQLTKTVTNAAGFNDPIPVAQYTFADVPQPDTFWIFVERLLLNRPDAMGGYPCGGPGEPCDPQNRPYFRPNNPLTRGQTAKIVSNAFFPGCTVPAR